MIDGIKSFFHIGNTPPAAPPAPPPPPPPPPPEQQNHHLPPRPDSALPATHTPAEARTAAEQKVFFEDLGTTQDQIPDEDGAFQNVSNPVHDGRQDLEATRQLFANQDQVNAKLATLTPEQQRQYNDLEATLENNPQGHLALQMLLLDNKLTDNDPAHMTSQPPPQNLLQALDAANHAPLDPHVDRSTLMGDMLKECAVPATIRQEGKNTCTVTSMQIMTANQRPAEFVRIAAGLAGPPGADGSPPHVKLANGQDLSRCPGCENDDGSHRSVSSRLWQASLMNYAAQQIAPGDHYDNQKDEIDDAQGHMVRNDGLTQDLAAGVASAVTGTNYSGLDARNVGAGLHQLVDNGLAAHPNTPFHASMRMGNFNVDGAGTHIQNVTITKLANGDYNVRDAQGHSHHMNAAELERRLEAVPGQTGPNAVMSQTAANDTLWNQVQSQLGTHGNVPVALYHGAVGNDGSGAISHEVVVTKIENGKVFFTNPHGDEEYMPIDQFRSRLHAVSTTAPPPGS